MKGSAFIGGAVVVGVLGILLSFRGGAVDPTDRTAPSEPSEPSAPTDPTERTDRLDPQGSTPTDAIEVFKRAFWRHPTESDHILHAERREGMDADGAKNWQWFIVVKPSPELIKHLRTDNAFRLVPATTPIPVPGAPEWFHFEPADADLLQAPGGRLQLAFGRQNSLLYATDSGGGFHPAAPEPVHPPQSPQPSSSARLPALSPPQPPSE